MSIAHAMPAMSRASGSRWLLLGSLALNLFFVGVALAMAIRAPAPPRWDPNVFVRVDRLSATLPPADADLPARPDQGHAPRRHRDRADANTTTRSDQIRDTFCGEPFDVEAMRAAMAKTRAARQNFDQVVQGVFADLGPQMSSRPAASACRLAARPQDRQASGTRTG